MSRYVLLLLLVLSGVACAQTNDYVVKPGDRIEVNYTYTPEYNQTLLVLSDGSIGLTRVGTVNIAGLTLPAATAKITDAAARSGLNKPEITLTLQDYLRPQFTVLGDVNRPGRFEMRGPLRVADGLAVAGGLAPNARHRNIILIHPIDETSGTTTLIDYKRLEKTKGDVTFDELRAGDIIVVPAGFLSKVERIVKLANFGIFYSPIP